MDAYGRFDWVWWLCRRDWAWERRSQTFCIDLQGCLTLSCHVLPKKQLLAAETSHSTLVWHLSLVDRPLQSFAICLMDLLQRISKDKRWGVNHGPSPVVKNCVKSPSSVHQPTTCRSQKCSRRRWGAQPMKQDSTSAGCGCGPTCRMISTCWIYLFKCVHLAMAIQWLPHFVEPPTQL